MPPPFVEVNLPNRGITWSGPSTVLARAEPAAGVPRKAVHIVIIATVLGGVTIFAIGLVVIYRLYMKKFDREERRRQSQVKKNGTTKEPTVPEPRKAPQKIGSHSIHDAQGIWSFHRRNSSLTVTTLSTSGSTRSTVSTDYVDPGPLVAPSPRAWNTDFAPAGPRPDSLPVYSRPAQQGHSGAYFNDTSWKNSAPRPPQKTYKMPRGYSKNAKQSRGDEGKGKGSMSKDFRKGESTLRDSPRSPIPFESTSLPRQQEPRYSPNSVLPRVGKRESEKRKRNHDIASTSMPSIDLRSQIAGDPSERTSVRGHQNRPDTFKSPPSLLDSPLESDHIHGNNHHGLESHSPSGRSLSQRGTISNNISPPTNDGGTVRDPNLSQQEAVDISAGFPNSTRQWPPDDDEFDPREYGTRL